MTTMILHTVSQASLAAGLFAWALSTGTEASGYATASPEGEHRPPASVATAARSEDPNLPDELSTSDWSSVRAAYDAQRHRVVATDGGHRALNPGQRWTTRFDGRGFLVHPDGGAWTWGLELEAYGWGEAMAAVNDPLATETDGGRLAYDWDERLTEWCVNDTRGVEHGFTVATRPEGAEGALQLEIAVRGGLEAVVSGDGRDVRFVDESGASLVNYVGLTVFDADEAEVPARFDASPQGLQLVVRDAGAAYPLTIDPIAQQAYLKASNTDASDLFGDVVAISGDTVVVGASFEDSGSTGVNGNQADNSKTVAGAAYVFVRDPGTGAWSQEAYLKASNTDSGDGFGGAVAISGDTAVVGASGEASGSTGVNGNQADNGATDAGAAYVFVRDAGTGAWSQEAYLKASNTEAADRFGGAVAISSDTVVVGASFEDSGLSGGVDNSATDAGAAYVFARDPGGAWSQEAFLKASNTDAGDVFGKSVGISGSTIVVGADFESSGSTGVNGNQSDNSAVFAGAAYVFVRDAGTGAWSQEAYLKASNTEAADRFGESVAISGNRVVVGAEQEGSGSTGVNGNQSDNSASSAGAAYVFVQDPSTGAWSQEAYLKASNAEADDRFGRPVAISGDTVIVGAWTEDSGSTGANGNQSDNGATDAGAAYVFVRDAGTGAWSQEAYLKASNTDANDQFGYSVAVSGNKVVVGARFEGSDSTGVNGSQSDNTAVWAGAAYVFEVSNGPVPYCTPKMSSAGCLAAIGTTSSAQPVSGGSDYQVTATNVHSVKVGLVFASLNGPAAIPWLGGTLCVAPPLAKRGPLVASGGFGQDNCTGAFATLVNDGLLPPDGLDAGPGNTMNYQYWYRDPANGPGNFGTALSDAIQLDFQ